VPAFASALAPRFAPVVAPDPALAAAAGRNAPRGLAHAPVAWAVALLAAATAQAQGVTPGPATPAAVAPPHGTSAAETVLEANAIRGQPDGETTAEGDVELRRGDITVQADRLSYRQPDDLARASGNVRLLRQGDRYTGRELQLKVERFEGFFLEPTYFFSRMQAGGQAQPLDFLGENRASALGATYTSCPVDGSGDPAWLLSTDKIRLDFDKNEGVAEGAVLRFYGVPVLGAPILSFPLSDERKSGWLPPNFGLDTKTGLQVAVPYYWNIAPNRDATFTPTIITKRGFGLDSEFRYLMPSYEGTLRANLLPNDKLYGEGRSALNAQHEGRPWQGALYRAQVLRVSDDAYWKDFPGGVGSLTPRLLPADLRAEQRVQTDRFGDWSSYLRVQRWQVLQDLETPIELTPYDRAPQLGLSTRQTLPGGLEFSFQTEFNRFENPDGHLARVLRPTGSRVHAIGAISRPWVSPGWTIVPKLSFNSARYDIERPAASGSGIERSEAQRTIPTFSLDSGWVFERDATWFARDVRQTLEPRLLYVRTPFRDQTGLPNFDSAAKDFNFESIYTDNAFSGIDRVSDAHQLTAGLTSRLIDAGNGAEVARLGLAQRFLFRDQRITPGDGPALTQRFSELLLLGSTNIGRSWRFDGAVQYDPDTDRTTRAVLGARWSPGPYRTLNTVYRLKRGENEQVELGWQWPVYGPAPGVARRSFGSNSGECSGTWYSVGRVNFSILESRVTDSVLGLEYDSGCWIGRLVAKRLSTSRAEATTQIGFEIEFVGLSRLGTNPLRVLKDNIPGYRLLRDDSPASSSSSTTAAPPPSTRP
jgi:LPS-assembly protein